MAFARPIDFSQGKHPRAGNNVRKLRMRLDPIPSPDELAKTIGCSGEQIRKLEGGFNNPGLQLARRIAAAFGSHIDYVFPPEAA